MFARRDSGFTIIEIMVVVLIIGILLTLAVPVFTAATDTVKARTCMANLRTLDSTVEQWKAKSDLDPATRWGGMAVNVDLTSCGNLIADLSPEIQNWDRATRCTTVDVQHHVTISALPNDRSTAKFLCQGGIGAKPHGY